MILDQSDPTGLGLFSRCARNQACKTSKTRPQTANSKKSLNSPQIIENRRQKTINQGMFSKQQSRQQRQRKYKREYTPAVGQYNNVILKPKPKLVWDVIKLFNKKTKNMKQLQQLKQKINNHHGGNRHYKSLDFDNINNNDFNNNSYGNTIEQKGTEMVNDSYSHLHTASNGNMGGNYSPSNKHIITEPHASLQKKSASNNKRHLVTQSFSNINNNKSSKDIEVLKERANENSPLDRHEISSIRRSVGNDQWPSGLKKKSIVNKKICMVDMSRTTGRQPHRNIKSSDRMIKQGEINDSDSQIMHDGNLQGNNNNSTKTTKFNLMSLNNSNQINNRSSQQFGSIDKSIERIKPRTKPNYYFKKMLGRKDQYSKETAGNIYDCNIDLVKIKQSALLNFGVVKGREDNKSLKRTCETNSYSYTHYDYNEYVWKSCSSVFPNTKKSLIPFNKQR